MEEKRAIGRIAYETPGVIVVCDTQEKIVVKVNNVSPKGMGIVLQENVPGILNKDIIIVADTLIMYAVIMVSTASSCRVSGNIVSNFTVCPLGVSRLTGYSTGIFCPLSITIHHSESNICLQLKI